MRTIGGNGAGRFSVRFEIANYRDLIRVEEGTLPPEKVRRRTVNGLVDPGASKLVLPQSLNAERPTLNPFFETCPGSFT